MGADLHYREGVGPQIDNPVRTPEDVLALKDFEPERDLPSPMEAIRICRQKTDKPILGFAGAPFTLACYLIEGGGSKTWHHTKHFMWSQPKAFKQLMDFLAIAVGKHLQAQINAGAVAVQLFDTWAGALSRKDYLEFALPSVQKVFSLVSGAPTLYFSRDSQCFIDFYPQTGADAFALDWRADWSRAKSILGTAPLQGNLDPIALQAPPEVIREKVHSIIRDAGPIGHVFNLGHGCTPQTPISGVQAAIDAVLEWDWSTVEQ
jgi:uroporphyrinogen decarboxylase